MDLEGKVILVDNTSKTLSPITRTLENYEKNKTSYFGAGYRPATDDQITMLLEHNGIDPTTYKNPLVPPYAEKSKKKKVIKETKEIVDSEKTVSGEQIKEAK